MYFLLKFKIIMKNKERQVVTFANKLKKIALKALSKGDYELSLSAISACGFLYYSWNQFYRDSVLEEYLNIISNQLVLPSFSRNEVNKDVVLFYDSFGGDVRGLTIIYLKTLCELGYNVIYVSPLKYKDKQPILNKTLNNYNVKYEYVNRNNYKETVDVFTAIINKYRPYSIFMHLLPNDTAAITVLNAYKDVIKRYQINLTDHAFWLGLNAFDFCIEFRTLGATISNKYRGIDCKKIILNPYYPYIDKNLPFKGFPSEISNKKVIFSGGALYKILGDEEQLYFKIVELLLLNNPNVAFVYATNDKSATSYFKHIIDKFPNRCIVIRERNDLFQVLKHSVLYLNTYPLSGGLMTQYAAIAGKLPLTLNQKNSESLDGILIDNESLGVEFLDYLQLIEEANKLLNDEGYRLQREALLNNAVISEEKFRHSLSGILENNSEYTVNVNGEISLEDFRQNYIRNFSINSIKHSQVLKNWKCLSIYFPLSFIGASFNFLFNLFKKIIVK